WRVEKTKDQLVAHLDMMGQLKWALESDDKPDFISEKKFEWVVKNCFGIEEVAKAVGRSIRTINRWIESGRIHPIHILGSSYFTKSEIIKLGCDYEVGDEKPYLNLPNE
ncbi:MAG: helix-turn-helix domain-containing protein, partial [bacterium]